MRPSSLPICAVAAARSAESACAVCCSWAACVLDARSSLPLRFSRACACVSRSAVAEASSCVCCRTETSTVRPVLAVGGWDAALSRCATSASSASFPRSSSPLAACCARSGRSSESRRCMSVESCSFHCRSDAFSPDTVAACSRSRFASACASCSSTRASASSCCEASYMACIEWRSSLSSKSCRARTCCCAATAGEDGTTGAAVLIILDDQASSRTELGRLNDPQ